MTPENVTGLNRPRPAEEFRIESTLGVVLAGGQSRRMGRDKAMLTLDGITLLERMVRRLHDSGCTEVVVSGGRAGFVSVPDRHTQQGPLAGLLAVAERFPGRRLLLAAVDTPWLRTTDLQTLMAADARTTHFQGHPLPLCVDADVDLRVLLDRWLSDPDGPRALHALSRIRSAEVLPVPREAESAFRNLNTPQDAESLVP